jgi:hypothetical protein
MYGYYHYTVTWVVQEERMINMNNLLKVTVQPGQAYELPHYLALHTQDGKSPFVVVGKNDPEAIIVQLWMPNGVTCGQCISFTGMVSVNVSDVKALIPSEFSLVYQAYEDDDYYTGKVEWHLVKQ